MTDEATLEKVYAAERTVAQMRLAVILLNSLVYLVLMEQAGTIPWLAYAVILVANAYAVGVLVFQPYRDAPVLMTSYVTSISDASLITLWILATGGIESPFYVLWYVSIVAIAFRYTYKETAVISVFYAACYLGLLLAIGEFQDPTALIVRTSYIGFVGILAGQLSEEAFKQTEAKVRMRSLMRKARLAESRFRRLLEAAPDAIVISDTRGRTLLVNTRAEDLFGTPKEQILGGNVERLVPGLFAATGLDTLRARGEELAVEAEPRPVELVARRKDGGKVPVEVSVRAMETRGGIVLTSIVRDITERKRAERELERRARELARSNAELEQFAYVASHDLQEPLRMVSSYVQLLARRYEDQLDEDADEYIAYAKEGATRMHNLINDLLAFSQADRADRPFELVDTEQLLDEVLANLSTTIEETGAKIEAGELPTIMADRGQIGQVLQNLVHNGIKFQNEVPPQITVSAERDGNDWVFSIQDNGIGIDPEYMHKIFIIFQRLNPRSEYPGTGIGLAICRKIIERHGGRIWVESQGDGTGTTFKFTIPVLRSGTSENLGQADRDALLAEQASLDGSLADGLARLPDRARELI